MAFQQFTSCIDAQFHNKTNQFVQATVAAAAAVAPLAVIPALVSPWCLVFLIPVAAAVWLLVYCQWFLHDRLICLPDAPSAVRCPGESDPVAIGMVVDILPPSGNSFPDSIDTDYSIGLLLAPNEPGETDRQIVEASMPFGPLMVEQPATHNIGVPFTSHQGTDNETGITSWVLHCEFEGAGVRDLMLAARISLVVALAAFAVCLFVPGPVGFVIALILALLSLLGDLLGAVIGQGDHASPADENPALGSELHSGDILVLQGSWVYDSGHNYRSFTSRLEDGGGWNEIHPIKFCTPMGRFDKEWPANINDLIAQWTATLCQSTSTGTLESQKQPENKWQVHPIIDGCQPSGVIL